MNLDQELADVFYAGNPFPLFAFLAHEAEDLAAAIRIGTVTI